MACAMCVGAACITVYFSATSMFDRKTGSEIVYNISVTNNNYGGDSPDLNLKQILGDRTKSAH